MPAHAHNAGVSTSRIVIHGRTIDIEINALARDYEIATGVRIADKGSGEVNPVALAVMAPAIVAYVSDHVAVLAAGQRCTAGPGTAQGSRHPRAGDDGWNCPSDDDLRYRVTLFQDADPAARHLALIASEGGERELALDKNAPEVPLSGAGSSMLQVVGRFVPAGIEHIFLGYDHIAFLIAVILWGRRCGH